MTIITKNSFFSFKNLIISPKTSPLRPVSCVTLGRPRVCGAWNCRREPAGKGWRGGGYDYPLSISYTIIYYNYTYTCIMYMYVPCFSWIPIFTPLQIWCPNVQPTDLILGMFCFIIVNILTPPPLLITHTRSSYLQLCTSHQVGQHFIMSISRLYTHILAVRLLVGSLSHVWKKFSRSDMTPPITICTWNGSFAPYHIRQVSELYSLEISARHPCKIPGFHIVAIHSQ